MKNETKDSLLFTIITNVELLMEEDLSDFQGDLKYLKEIIDNLFFKIEDVYVEQDKGATIYRYFNNGKQTEELYVAPEDVEAHCSICAKRRNGFHKGTKGIGTWYTCSNCKYTYNNRGRR